MGRPTKLTPAIWGDVVKALQGGMLLHEAAEFAGIDRETLRRWMRRGERAKDPEDEYRGFCGAVSKARNAAKLRAVALIHTHMTTNWKAAAWWLSVTDPKNYGPKVRVTVEQEYSDALARLRGTLPAEVYETVLDALLSGGSVDGEAAAPAGEKLEH